MRVLFVERQPCMRALKYARAIAAVAPEVTLAFAYQGMTLSAFYGTGDELFERWERVGVAPEADLARVIDDFRPDVIHSHNLPDALTVVAQDIVGGRIPVIHDVHDFGSLRKTPYEDGFPDLIDPEWAERRAVEDSDGLVTVGPELLDEISSRYRVPDEVVVIPNLVMRGDLPELPPAAERPERRLQVAYQGSLNAGEGHYDLRAIFGKLLEAGVDLHVHPSRPAGPEYHAMATAHARLHLYEPLAPFHLMQRLTTYDVGWAGFNTTHNGAHLDTVLPNKAFEYVGCGLPVVTLPHAALERWVTDEGLGVVISRPEQVVAEVATVDLAAIRTHVRQRRTAFTMEAAIGDVLSLYERLAGGGAATASGAGGARKGTQIGRT